MEDKKRVLIADFDEMGRFGTKLICRELENVQVLIAATKEGALSIINGHQALDLVIVDPMRDLHIGWCRGKIEANEGTFGVMNSAISRGVKVLIVTTLPETVEQRLLAIGMEDCYEEIVCKATGPDETRDAIVRALAD